MVKQGIFFFFLFILVVSSYALYVDGIIDVCPAGFMADKSTPVAVHFSCWTTAFQGYSTVSAKLRIQSALMDANNYTWSSTVNSWRPEGAGIVTLNAIPITNNTVSGWLFGISSSVTYFGPSTCKVRMYRPGSSLPYDIATSINLYAWSTTTAAGWIEGTNPVVGASCIVLARDSSGKILGSYITENNQINEIPAYPNTAGYFKLGIPVGKVQLLEFRNLNNQIIGIFSGPWSISAGKSTDVGHPTLIDFSKWNKY